MKGSYGPHTPEPLGRCAPAILQLQTSASSPHRTPDSPDIDGEPREEETDYPSRRRTFAIKHGLRAGFHCARQALIAYLCWLRRIIDLLQPKPSACARWIAPNALSILTSTNPAARSICATLSARAPAEK